MKLQQAHYQLDYVAIEGQGPCVVFCGGFNSNKQGNKALALEAFCMEKGQAFIRFDYSGHGQSGGDFNAGNISQWLSDTLAIVDHAAKGNVVLVGSSMGGWIALLAAQLRPTKVSGLLLIACAADMTKHYLQRINGLAPQNDSAGRAYYRVPNDDDDQQPYTIYQHMMVDGAKHTLLDRTIELTMPIRLIHGMQDTVVPWQRSQVIVQKLRSDNVSLHLVKAGDHRLSSDEDLALIAYLLSGLL